ncbi:excalibur calcium-binding domain-containing protein [Neisseria weixii]|nr:excalibur calcium-binding domain-containing protein [Neisseria weixii]
MRHCPDTKMDGDNDGIPCQDDSRRWPEAFQTLIRT